MITKSLTFSLAGTKRIFLLSLLLLTTGLWISCGPSGDKPVDIESGDVCSFCGMDISQPVLASEIIYNGKVYKFDDLACMNAFKTKRSETAHAPTFVVDFATKQWIRAEGATIVATNVETPMGSGLIGFADSARARQFAAAHPPKKAM